MVGWSGDESPDQEHIQCQGDRNPVPLPARLLGRVQEDGAATYMSSSIAARWQERQLLTGQGRLVLVVQEVRAWRYGA
jgi:hypothetical protein